MSKDRRKKEEKEVLTPEELELVREAESAWRKGGPTFTHEEVASYVKDRPRVSECQTGRDRSA